MSNWLRKVLTPWYDADDDLARDDRLAETQRKASIADNAARLIEGRAESVTSILGVDWPNVLESLGVR